MTTHEFTLMVEGPDLQDEARLITAFNAGLSWRDVSPHLPEDERRRIRSLAG